jgi:hypothetical protein
VSAEILCLNDFRVNDAADDEIDLVTVLNVAVRDLREILACWGTEVAWQRAHECESMMSRAVSRTVEG